MASDSMSCEVGDETAVTSPVTESWGVSDNSAITKRESRPWDWLMPADL